jgi:hypothetical protein
VELFSHSWLPYLYLYGVGGLCFFIGIYVVRKSGALKPRIRRHRTWLRVLYFGLAWYMALHAVLTILAFR